MTDYETIRSDIDAIDRRLAEIEAHQWTANGRLRQDTSGLTFDLGTVAAMVLAVWAGVPFHWWYLPIAAVLLPFARSHSHDRAWRQEQTRNGMLR